MKNKEPTKDKGGRPSKYNPAMNEKVYKLCLLGATDNQIADFFDVDQSTINRWKKTEPEFCKSLKKGKQEADSKIAESLYHRAKGYVAPETITATFQGQITDTLEVKKHYPPDTVAAIFWLKNRQPQQWRDKQEVDTNTNMNITIKLEPVRRSDNGKDNTSQ